MESRGQAPSKAQLNAWVQRHGAHSASYTLLEGNKRYLVHPDVDGFVAVETRWGIPIIAGDPVCEPDAAAPLLRRVRRAYWPRPVYAYAIRPELIAAFRRAGFGVVPVGSEPVFDPRVFCLAGGDRATVRAAVNHARKAGLQVSEHHPTSERSAQANAELDAVSREWLGVRGNRELGFLLGQPQLDRPSSKRYFVARSATRVEGFVVCEPVFVRRGWYIDVTRRRLDAARGTIELLITEALSTFGREDAAFVTLGLSPLARLEACALDGVDAPALCNAFGAAFARVRDPYDFAALYRYKRKFAPDAWEARYFAFTRGAGRVLAEWATRRAVARARLGPDAAASKPPPPRRGRPQ